MSLYTTEVRYICETAAGRDISVGYNDIDDVLTPAVMNSVMPNYPIFDETYRNVLNKKILEHYYTREISEETVGLWKLRMRAKMNEIMPYYNKLYLSEALSFNPLYDVDLTKEYKKAGQGSEYGDRDKANSIDETLDRNKTDIGGNIYDKTNVNSSSKSIENTENGNTAKMGNEIENGTEDTSTKQSQNKVGSTLSNGAESNSEDMSSSQGVESVGASTGSTDNVKDELKKYIDTPQGAVTNLLEGTYLTNATSVGATDKQSTQGSTSSEVDTELSSHSSGSKSHTANESTSESADNTEDVSLSRGRDNRYSENIANDKFSSGNEALEGNATERFAQNTNTVSNEDTSRKQSGNERETSNKVLNTTEDYLEHISGKQGTGSYSKLLMEYRETFLNIDMMIIDELKLLFFGLWG